MILRAKITIGGSFLCNINFRKWRNHISPIVQFWEGKHIALWDCTLFSLLSKCATCSCDPGPISQGVYFSFFVSLSHFFSCPKEQTGLYCTFSTLYNRCNSRMQQPSLFFHGSKGTGCFSGNTLLQLWMITPSHLEMNANTVYSVAGNGYILYSAAHKLQVIPRISSFVIFVVYIAPRSHSKAHSELCILHVYHTCTRMLS